MKCRAHSTALLLLVLASSASLSQSSALFGLNEGTDFHQDVRLKRQSDTCRTPENQPGRCIPKEDCSELVELAKLADVLPDAASYLRKTICRLPGSLMRQQQSGQAEFGYCCNQAKQEAEASVDVNDSDLTAAVNNGKPMFVQADSIVSDNCLQCICEGTSGCDVSAKCRPSGDFCGPFWISRAYWIDAGQPVLRGQNPNTAGAFESCTLASSYSCAAQTIRNYMKRFQQDCNGDGVIDCEDFFQIHLNGGYSCSQSLERHKYYQQFLKCKTRIL